MKRLLALSAVMLFGLSANTADRPTTTDGTHAYLEVTMENKTTRDIDEAAVVFGERRCTFGIVGAGFGKGYLGWNSPVGTNAVVQWRDAQKTRHEKTVVLVEVYKRREPGALLFSVTTTNVLVSFRKIDRK